jgi:transaldolase
VNIELQKPQNEPLIIESIQQAKKLYEKYASEVTFEQFASEVMVSPVTQMAYSDI